MTEEFKPIWRDSVGDAILTAEEVKRLYEQIKSRLQQECYCNERNVKDHGEWLAEWLAEMVVKRE